jgi:CubicO group peptidase (beta-lactamase class C family)
MSTSGLSTARLGRMREVLAGHVASGRVPGLVALVVRRGEAHVEVIGTTEADGAGRPMRRDTIFRIASLTKPIVAAAALTLLEECLLRLDDPVDDLLPELAGARVLREPGAQLDDTVPAHRPITVRDLLTFRLGTGAIMAPPGTYPIQRAMDDAVLSPGHDLPPIRPDEWMKRLGSLPLVYQPGEKWLYHTGSDILGVLMARATGQPLADLLTERVLGPLGMQDTGFHVPAAKLDRLPAAYRPDPETGAPVLIDDPRQSTYAHPPPSPPAAAASSPPPTTCSPSTPCCSTRAATPAGASCPARPSSS